MVPNKVLIILFQILHNFVSCWVQPEKVSPHSLRDISKSYLQVRLGNSTPKWWQSTLCKFGVLILGYHSNVEQGSGQCLRERCIVLGTWSNQEINMFSCSSPLFWNSKKGADPSGKQKS